MDEITKPVASLKPEVPAQPKPAPERALKGVPTPDMMLSGAAIEALADIAARAGRLARMQAEKTTTDDGYQVIDPRTVAATVQESAYNTRFDFARLAAEQMRLWGDIGLLWQQTATRVLTNAAADSVVSPSAQDKRFKNNA